MINENICIVDTAIPKVQTKSLPLLTDVIVITIRHNISKAQQHKTPVREKIKKNSI